MKIYNDRSFASILAASLMILLLPSSSATELNLALAHQLVIVDQSGSMQGQYKWIGEAVSELQDDPDVSTQFSLMEFSKGARPIEFGGGLFGNAEEFNHAITQLKRGGGIEDGYFAIEKATNQYSATEILAPHIILITDEHRTSIELDMNGSSLASKLAEAQIPVTAIINVRFICDDKRRAFGMTAFGKGITLDPYGRIEECTIGELLESKAGANSITDYLDLALSTGGSAWDIKIPRVGTKQSAMFATAFAQIHGAAIQRNLGQVDVIPKIAYFPDRARVGETITFDASGSQPTYEGDYMRGWQWDFDSDEQFDMNGDIVAHAFTTPGVHEITLSLDTNESNGPIIQKFTVEVLD